jgi:threonine dehydratase
MVFHKQNGTNADVGKILAGIQVPPADKSALEQFLHGLGYPFWDETENTVYKRFMTKNMG